MAGHYDLIVASDVFNYLGALERIIGWCAASLAVDGRLIFTVERSQSEDVPLTLCQSRRFAHGRQYVHGLLRTAGFGTIRIEDVVLRKDRGVAVNGFCVMACGLNGPGQHHDDRESELPADA